MDTKRMGPIEQESTSAGAVAELDVICAPIRDEMDRLAAFLAGEFESREPFLHAILSHIASFRGKRLRPALLFLFHKLARGRVTDDLIKIGAVLEMIHTATLVHDDLLDAAELRRQVATVHCRWGDRPAILIGDYIYSRAFELSTQVPGMAGVLARTTTEICEGELLQIGHRFKPRLEEEVYLEIIRKKTAILHAVACELGGRLAQVDEPISRAFHGFGLDVGTAFQVIDDCLDFAGDEEVVGKSLGTDLHQGKMTLPLILLRERLSPDERLWLESVLVAPLAPEDEERIRALVSEHGVIGDCLVRAQEMVDCARERLVFAATALTSARGAGAVDEEVLECLRVAAAYVLERKR
ncbi:MAG TPA: polyprenyl synthetase family protein [Planctomycetota bacterium]|nr:polyprenyl synthetase family protein [Planctomycetota bacterium]